MKTQTRIGLAVGLALALLAGLAPRAKAADASGSWNSTGNGTWSDTTKWTTTPLNNYPTGIGQSATIALNTTANAVITLDTSVTLGSILIGDGTANTYDVQSGGATITMDTGTASPATINKQHGATRSADSISVPLVLQSDLEIYNTVNGSPYPFNVNGAISESGGPRNVTCSVTLSSANAIVLNSTASSYSGKTTVRWGTLNFASIGNVGGGNSALGAPTTVANGTIDIGDGANAVFFACTAATAMRTDRILNFVGTTGALSLKGGAANQLTYTSPFQFTGSGAKTLTLNGVVVNGDMVNSDLTVVCGQAAALAFSSALLGLNTYKNGTSIYGATLTINSLANVTTPGTPSSLGAPETVANGTIVAGAAGYSGPLKYVGTGHSSDRVFSTPGTGTGGLVLDASGYGKLTLSGNVNNSGASSKTVTLQGTGEGELSGVITDYDAARITSLSKTGSGTWTLKGDNSSGFTGTITINGAGGTLEVGHDSALNNRPLTLTAGNLAAQGAARSLNNTITAISSGFGFTGSQDLELTQKIPATAASRTLYNTIVAGKTLKLGAMDLADASARTTTFEGAGDTIINGIIANGGAGAGALTMSGLGTLTLKGANSYTGATALNSGTVLVDYAAGADMPATALTLGGGTLKAKGAASGATADTYGNVTVALGGGALLVDPNGGTGTTLTLGSLAAGVAGGSALFGKAPGAGSGSVTITTTTPQGATGIYPAHTLFTDGSSTGYDWLSTASGGPTYTLSGYASYVALATTADTDTSQSRITGNTTMSGARITNTLKIENPPPGQTLAIGAHRIDLTGGGLLATGSNGFTITGDAGSSRLRANFSTGLIIHQYNSGGLTISAVIANWGVTLTTLTKAGSGTLTLSGVNTYTGSTLANAGILELRDNSALGTGGSVFVKPGASVQLNGSGLTLARPIASLAGTGTDGSGALKNVSGANTWSGAITIGTGGARIGNADTGNALTLSGGIVTAAGKDLTLGGAGNIVVSTTAISGAGAIAKDGAGTTEWSAVNTATGPIAVNGGTLKVTGSIAAGSKVTVNNTGILTGNGTCSGTVRVNNGGTIKAPGTVGEKLTVGSLILDNSSIASFTVGGSDTEDYIDVTDTGYLIDTLGLAILPGAKVYLSNPNQGGTFQLIKYAGEIKGSVANLTVVNATVGTVYTFSEAGGFVQLVVTPNAVPVIGQASPLTPTMDEDGSPTPWSAPTLTATDADSGHSALLEWSVSSPATHGTATVNGTGTAPTTFTYVPNGDYYGSDSFVVKVTDPLLAEATITVNVTIAPRNDAPVCTVVPVVSGAHLVGSLLSTGNGTWNDTKDITYGGSFSPTFTYQWQRADDSGGGGMDDILPATSSTYTLTGSEAGKYVRVRVTCTDSGEGGPGVQSTQAFSTPWSLVVANNVAPTIVQTGPLTPTMDEDGIPTAWSAPTLTASDSGDEAILEWSVSSPASHGLATVEGTGTAPATFTYVPTGDYNGSDSFDVKVSDGKPSGDATITVNVTIDARNDAPVCTVAPTHTFRAPDTAPLLINKTVMVNSDGTWNDTKDTQHSGSFSPTFTYQWQRANDSGGGGQANIPSANGSSYTIVSADEEKWIRVAVTCTDNAVGLPATANATAYSPWQYVYKSYNLRAASDTAIGSNMDVIEIPPDTVLVAGANPTYTYDFAMSSLNLNNWSIRDNSGARNVVLANLLAVSDSGAGSIDTRRATGATGYIELYAAGPVQIGGSLMTATTGANSSGTGSIRVDGTSVQIGGSVLTHTLGNNLNHSGSVTINAPGGAIGITSYVATYNNSAAGVFCQAGAVALNAGSITIGGNTTGLAIAAQGYGTQQKQGANVALTATSGITLSTGGIATHGYGGGDVLISDGAGGSAGDVYIGGSILSYSDPSVNGIRSGAITVRGGNIRVTGDLNNDYMGGNVLAGFQPILISGSGSVRIDGYVTDSATSSSGIHTGNHNVDLTGGSVTVNGMSGGYSVRTYTACANDTAGNITVTATTGDLTLAGGVDASHPTTESKRGAVALSAPNGKITVGSLDMNLFKTISLQPGAGQAVHVTGALSNFTVNEPQKRITFPANCAIGSDIYYMPAANTGIPLTGDYDIWVTGSGDTGKKLMSALARLTITTQPSASTLAGAAFAEQPVVTIVDGYGVVTSGDDATASVTLTLTTGAGTLGGTATMNAVGGVADFAGKGLNINLVGADKVLTATATLSGQGAKTVLTSPAFAITHAAASQLVITMQPSASTVAGVAFGQQPVVQIQDAYGNVVDSGDDATRSVALTLTTGTGTLGGTATMNAVGGVANFAGQGLNINLIGADKVLTAAATLTGPGVVTTTTSPALTITHAAASQVAFTTQPSASTWVGLAFAQQPVVMIEDPYGNVVSTGADATRSVALSLTMGTGTLGGTATMNAIGGVADFVGKGLMIDMVGVNKVLTATATLTGPVEVTATTSPFAVILPPQTIMEFR